MISRSCRLCSQLDITKPVTDSVHGGEEPRPIRIPLNLSAEIRDVGVQGPIESLEVVAEYPLDDPAAGVYLSRRSHEMDEKVELGRRELDRVALDLDDAGVDVDRQFAVRKHVANVFLAALEAPAAATEALREAIRMHDRRIIDDR